MCVTWRMLDYMINEMTDWQQPTEFGFKKETFAWINNLFVWNFDLRLFANDDDSHIKSIPNNKIYRLNENMAD